MGVPAGLKPKDLIGMPWRIAFALQENGWYLRSDIIWHKSNPMPESVKDRPTKAHEYLFLLTKAPRYYYDGNAIREQMKYSGLKGQDPSGFKDPMIFSGKYAKPTGWATGDDAGWATASAQGRSDKQRVHSRRHAGFNDRWDHMSKDEQQANGRNKRDVWTIATFPFPEAHFATYPPKLIEPCILAGCPHGGIVLDPFMGAGTTALVALQHGRKFVGIELNPAYREIALRRLQPYITQRRLCENEHDSERPTINE